MEITELKTEAYKRIVEKMKSLIEKEDRVINENEILDNYFFILNESACCFDWTKYHKQLEVLGLDYNVVEIGRAHV